MWGDMMVLPGLFRTCPVTGLRVHLPTQRLIIANFVMALLSIVIGGIAAIFVGFSRGSTILVKDPEQYYIWLTAHGFNMLIFWILWFEVALVYFVSTVLLNTSIYSSRIGWLAFTLMLIGWLVVNVTVFTGNATVMFTAYPPMAAHPLFYLGYILFALGVFVALILFFLTLYKARVEGTYKGHLPLVTWGAAIAAIIGLTVVTHGAVALLTTFVWRLGLVESIDVMFYRWFFWGLGHNAQYVNVTAMVAVWYALLTLATGYTAARFVNERYARIAFALYTLFVVPGIGHHILVDPGFSVYLKQASGSVGSHLLSVPSMLHALALLGGLEATLRAAGHTGLFGWLAKIPWRNPGVAGLLLSMLLFGIGGVIAQPQTTLQPNLLFHNTMWVPAHFHLTVVGGTTLAFMALSYYVVPLLTLRRLISTRLATIQVYTAFIGILILAISMAILGWLGSPRRTLVLPELMKPEWWGPATLLVVGAAIWIASGALWVVLMLFTVLAGRRSTDPGELTSGLISAIIVKEGAKTSKMGSLVIVIIFLVVIMLALYFYSFLRLGFQPPFW